MNYGALKGLVVTVVKKYKCPECNSEVNENNIEVIGAAGNTINIDVECAKCGKHSLIKSEIITFDLSKIDFNSDFINKIKTNIGEGKINVTGNISKISKKIKATNVEKKHEINDNHIVDLNKNLKKRNISVFELLGDDNR